jgi:four helix bundle protein
LQIVPIRALELETQLELGKRLVIVPERDVDILVSDAQEIGRMLNGLVRSPVLT